MKMIVSCSFSSISCASLPPRRIVVQSIPMYSINSGVVLPTSLRCGRLNRGSSFFAMSRSNGQAPDSNISRNLNSNPKRQDFQSQESKVPPTEDDNIRDTMPIMRPRKPRRGRKSEAAAVEDFVRDSLERTLASVREQKSDTLDDQRNISKQQVDDDSGTHGENEIETNDGEKDDGGKSVVAEEDSSWPVDADVRLGIRASEYFEKHPIKNVVGEDGVEIDWEGEIDEGLVNEISCLEWERFAFHPSPLIVLVFERYNRASENWKVLKELEEAAKVYWRAKDRLPPRTIKIDINIETDLAYALKVKECPQILFLRGNRIVYREKEFRTSEELVQMIAHFYYNAKKPSFIK